MIDRKNVRNIFCKTTLWRLIFPEINFCDINFRVNEFLQIWKFFGKSTKIYFREICFKILSSKFLSTAEFFSAWSHFFKNNSGF